MTKRYQCGTKLLSRLSSSSGAAVVAAPQPFQTKKNLRRFGENEIWNSISCPKSSISNLVSSSRSFSFFSPPGAAPSSRGTARRGGRWPVPEAAHRCRRRRQQRLQRLRQLQRLGLRFTTKKMCELLGTDLSQPEESHSGIRAEHYLQKISNLSQYSLYTHFCAHPFRT